MSVTINYKINSTKKNSPNLILFTDEKFSISGLKKLISDDEYSIISDLIKVKDFKKKILSFDVSCKANDSPNNEGANIKICIGLSSIKLNLKWYQF